MLTRIDRIQVVTRDRKRTVERWRRLLAAEPVREDRVAWLAAQRVVLRVGDTEVEVLERDGVGPVGDHLSRFKEGLFAAGAATRDLEAVRRRCEALGVHYEDLGGQLWLHHDWLDIPGLHLVVSQEEERSCAGLATRLYEVTHLCHDYEAAAARFAHVFGLEPRHFVPIRSEEYGYDGTLTLFDPDRLDRIETVTPFEPTRPMGRFFERRGPSLYMAYVEAPDVAAVRERLMEHEPKLWAGSRTAPHLDNLFIHPHALDGVLLGVSRDSFAWTWSGQPARVVPAAEPPRAAAAGGAG